MQEQVKSGFDHVAVSLDGGCAPSLKDAAANALLLCQWLKDKAHEGRGFTKKELIDSAEACEANIRLALEAA